MSQILIWIKGFLHPDDEWSVSAPPLQSVSVSLS